MTNTSQHTAPVGAEMQPAAVAAEPPIEIFDRYANSVVGCNATLYDAVEVHGVRNFSSGIDDGTCYEVDNITPTSFSVYAHLKGGGVDCVGDFGKYQDAVQYGEELGAKYGWPVRNFVLDQHRTTTLASLQ